MLGAVLREVGNETADGIVDVVDNLELAETGPGLVRVAIKATGVCHSDLSGVNGTIPVMTPCILGHEGAGEVVEVGQGVPNVKPGDHVIVVWVPPCGLCQYCLGGQANICSEIMATAGFAPRFLMDGQPAYGFAGTGTFAEETLLPWQSVVKIPNEVPLEIGSLIGCGVMTGVGAAINCAQVKPGSSVIVFGCGGVGIATIQGARLAGAAEIVAVDVVPEKLEMAKRFGATHGVKPNEVDAIKAELTNGQGFDYAFEVIGLPQTIRASYDAARRGGTAVIVGVGRANQTIEFNAFELFYMEKALKGTIYGSADVRRDFPRLIRLWQNGRLDLEGMISQRLGLNDVSKAFDDMKAGRVIRSVIEMEPAPAPARGVQAPSTTSAS